MKTVLVTYATPSFAVYQTINTLTARRAGFDECRAFGPADLDPVFVRANANVLAAPRGAGYWLWKPWLVARELGRLGDGDVLVYADAATHFVRPITPILDLLENADGDVLVFGEGFRESQYTKRDAFVLMDCDASEYVDSPQRFASVFAVRRWADTLRFAEEYLAYALDPRILTDAANVMGLPDYPDFIAHRHDQSVFSLLTKRYGVIVPENALIVEGLDDREGAVIGHTRTHESPARIVQRLLGHGILRPEDLAAFRVGS